MRQSKKILCGCLVFVLLLMCGGNRETQATPPFVPAQGLTPPRSPAPAEPGLPPPSQPQPTLVPLRPTQPQNCMLRRLRLQIHCTSHSYLSLRSPDSPRLRRPSLRSLDCPLHP